MSKVRKQIRQGDVLLNPINKLPPDAVKIRRRKTITLAEGELTGHSHTVEASVRDVETYESGGELYLKVNTTQSLRHQEHAELAIDPGLYVVRRQTEVWMDEVRQVAD